MIVVFGSLIADLLFAVPRLPRPGETVLGQQYLVAAGGKGANQALAAARDGARVAMAGAVGRDAFADVVLGGLRAAGVDLSHVLSLDAPTGCAAVGVDGEGDNQIMVASGANALATAAGARARGCRVMLNLAPALPLSDTALRAVDWLLVNEIEAAALAGQCNATDASPRALAQALGITVIATYGALGAVASAVDGVVKVPALAVDVADTTGAGDAFAGVLAAALDRGASLEVGLRRAAVAGSLSCIARGAQTALPDRPAIDAALAALS